jgi:hypothetical protein
MSNNKCDNKQITQLQNKLKNNSETKRYYIDQEDVHEDYENDFNNSIEIIPKTVRKINKNENLNTVLFEEYLKLQEIINNTLEQVHTLNRENAVEEVKSRYLKLDLNNLQIDLAAKELQLEDTRKNLYKYRNNFYISVFVNILVLFLVLFSKL